MSVEIGRRLAPAEALELATELARTAIRSGAPEADRNAAFPEASISALAKAGLLHAALSVEHGGPGLDTATLAEVARTIGRACGSTAMIWAMHQVQIACVDRHRGDSATLAELLAGSVVASDGLVASVTSERGVGGDLRSSRTCCERDGDRVSVVKEATTVSYLDAAGSFLITARRSPDSAPGDQVAVLATRDQVMLANIGGWNVMGMRGTCSPGCTISATVDAAQVLPVPFAVIAASTMVPLSHILWSNVWIGMAEEALARAIRYLRATRRDAPDPRLAAAGQRLGLLSGLSRLVIDGYDRHRASGQEPPADFGIELNNLKLAASTETVRVAEAALEICGMAGYQEEGDLSVARLLRDLYSARLMIANSRLVETNGASLLMRRYG